MFYESINTKLSNYPRVFIPQTHHSIEDRNIYNKCSNKNKHLSKINIIVCCMCVSIDLKPSRQCSCRLTHTESYTVCQVQILPSILNNNSKKIQFLLSSDLLTQCVVKNLFLSNLKVAWCEKIWRTGCELNTESTGRRQHLYIRNKLQTCVLCKAE